MSCLSLKKPLLRPVNRAVPRAWVWGSAIRMTGSWRMSAWNWRRRLLLERGPSALSSFRKRRCSDSSCLRIVLVWKTMASK